MSDGVDVFALRARWAECGDYEEEDSWRVRWWCESTTRFGYSCGCDAVAGAAARMSDPPDVFCS
jgi:hypothetical protein